MVRQSHQSLVIWSLLDGRPGHENQVLGLTEALERRVSVQSVRIPLRGRLRGLAALLSGSTGSLLEQPAPDMIVGAGHASHVPLWISARRFGGKSVVLMRPNLPVNWFDFCLVSDLDNPVRPRDNVIVTKGVLNRMQPGSAKLAGYGLIVVGGPSKHFEWSDRNVLQQIQRIVEHSGDVVWNVVTSRRTPGRFCEAYGGSKLNAEVVRVEDVDSSWLPREMAQAGTVWVTQDSVSMTYEALSSGSRVGMVELTSRREARISRGIRRLTDSGEVTTFSNWLKMGELPLPALPYREADRCADLILQRVVASDAISGDALSVYSPAAERPVTRAA